MESNETLDFLKWISEEKGINVKEIEDNFNTDQGKQRVAELYNEYKKEMDSFKCGGKVSALAKRRRQITKNQWGGKTGSNPIVESDSFLNRLFPETTKLKDTKTADGRNITRRKIYGTVDSNGNQRYVLDEVVGDNSAESFLNIKPGVDTTITQTLIAENPLKKTYEKGSPEYNSILDRFIKSGILESAHGLFPKTRKK